MNDADVYSLPKEEVDFDPTKTEKLSAKLSINDKNTISAPMPWIVNDVSDKIENSLGMDHLSSLKVEYLLCKPWVANEFLDLSCNYDLHENGLDKLIFDSFSK